MSKLDSFIRRMQAQRDCLNYAAREIRDLPGNVFELGLGNGRTYDHLCELLPNRTVYAFDRRMKCYQTCTPPAECMFVGEITKTLPSAAARLGRSVALVHMDLGTTDRQANANLLQSVAPLLQPLLKPGAVVVSNQALPEMGGWRKLAEPPGVKPGRYFLYRVDHTGQGKEG